LRSKEPRSKERFAKESETNSKRKSETESEREVKGLGWIELSGL